MKLSRPTDFSLRILMHLAREKERVTNRELSRKLSIPAAYLVKLVREMSRHGYLRTIKGKRGGVQPLKNPKEITILEIVELTEGPINLSDCFVDPKYCELDPNCGLKNKIGHIQGEIKKLLNHTSVADLIARKGAR
jgi:Rrf2 family nitric oxide-sensitive transcriptional repressor